MRTSKTLSKAFLSLILLLLAVSLSFQSCKKKEPEKPQISTTEFVIQTNDWYDYDGYYHNTRLVSEITSEVYNSGFVFAYIKYGNAWLPLPDSYGVNQTNFAYDNTSMVEIFNMNLDGTHPPVPPVTTIKIVVVPKGSMIKKPTYSEALELSENGIQFN